MGAPPWDETAGDGARQGGGRLLVDALRRVAAGYACGALTEREFAMAFPGDACEMLATFRVFLQAVAHASRRRLRTGHPGSPTLTPDEHLLLVIIAAAQHRDEPRFEAHLCWLARADGCDSVALAARALATALAVHGHWLPAQFVLTATTGGGAAMPP